MLNLEDDMEMDRLSIEASEHFNAPHEPSWETFLPILNEALPEKKKRRFIFFWWILLGLFVSGTGYYFINHTQKSNALATSGSIEEKIATNTTESKLDKQTTTLSTTNKNIENKTQTELENTKLDEKVVENKHNESTSTAGDAPLKNKKQDAQKLASVMPKISNSTKNKKAVNFKASKKVRTNNQVDNATLYQLKNDITQAKKQQDIAATKAINNTNQNSNTVTANPTIINNDNGNTQSVVAATISNDSLQKKNIDTVALNKNKDTTKANVDNSLTKKKTIKKQKAFSIEAVVTADFSTVKLKYGNGVSFGGGFMLGYHFNNKLSVHTGAIFTQKEYKAAGSDFTIPKGAWAPNYAIQTVDGYCRMWDIPLVVRYNIKQNTKRNIFVSTGLSSYFMQKENYDYYYSYSGRDYVKNINIDSSSNYLFSVLNLSVGIEKRLGKKLNLHIEPYAKIPLAGVGFGSIRLSSYGVNLALQFKQPFKH